MTALASVLIVMALGAVAFALSHRRPALLLIGAAILVSHALPVALFDGHEHSATMAAYRADVVRMTALSSLAWLLGYWLLARRGAAVQADHTAVPDFLPWHVVVVVALVVLIGIAPGGPIGFAQAGFLRLPVETPLFSLTYAMACLCALTTSLMCLRQIENGGHAPWFSISFILAVFWLLGGRTQLVITGLSFALVYLAHGRMPLRRLVLPGLIIALLAAQTLSFRLSLQGQETDLIASLPMTLAQMSLLEGYALSARYAADMGLHPGHYWDVVQQIMPRTIFPEKPMQLSRELPLMEARDTLGGLTPGLVGEAFAAGGHLWVCAMGVVFGGVLALLDNAYASLKAHSAVAQALVVALIPLLGIFVLRGGFDTGIFRLAVLLAGCSLLALARPSPALLRSRG